MNEQIFLNELEVCEIFGYTLEQLRENRKNNKGIRFRKCRKNGVQYKLKDIYNYLKREHEQL